jgi:preprotein translocase subunit Sss1
VRPVKILRCEGSIERVFRVALGVASHSFNKSVTENARVAYSPTRTEYRLMSRVFGAGIHPMSIVGSLIPSGAHLPVHGLETPSLRLDGSSILRLNHQKVVSPCKYLYIRIR